MIVSELKEVVDVKLGETSVSKVMVGDKEAWPGGPNYFYVWHSATGIIERFEVCEHFNLVDKVTSGYSYAGYASTSNGKGDYCVAIENGEADTLTFVDDKLQDINCNTYDGTTLVTGNKILKAKYYRDEPGNDMTPVKDTIYYLVEWDANFGKCFFLHNGETNNPLIIYGIFGIVADNNISGCVFEINGTQKNASMSSSLNISYNGITYKLSSTDAGLPRGYLCSNADIYKNINNNWGQNETYKVKLGVLTLDGISLWGGYITVKTHDMQLANIEVIYD